MPFYHKQALCAIITMTTTLLIWGFFYLISLLENNSTGVVCHNCHNGAFKAVWATGDNIIIIGEGVKKAWGPQRCLCHENAAGSPGQSKTKPNKTWRQSRGFHQFRGELPGYRLNTQRLYNESLKTFPSGSLSLPLMHTWTRTCVYIQLQFSAKCRFETKASRWWRMIWGFPFDRLQRKPSPSFTLKPLNIFSHSQYTLNKYLTLSVMSFSSITSPSRSIMTTRRLWSCAQRTSRTVTSGWLPSHRPGTSNTWPVTYMHTFRWWGGRLCSQDLCLRLCECCDVVFISLIYQWKISPTHSLIYLTQHQSYKKMKPAGFQERRKGNRKIFWSFSG